MRVAVPLGGTDWGKSGIGTYVRSTVPRMAARLRETGDSLFVIGNDAELSAYESAIAGLEQVRIGAAFNRPAPSALWYLAEAGPTAQRHRADVVFFPAAQRRYCVRQPIPTVAVIHDLGQLHVPEKYDRLRMLYFKRLMLPLIAGADVLVAISKATRDDMLRFMQVAPGRICVVPNGVETGRYVPMARDSKAVVAARAHLGLPEHYVLYPSRLEHPAKNHLRLLQAFAESPLRDTHVLALAGGDWGGGELIAREISSLGLGTRVRVLGYVADEWMPPMLAGADAVAMVGLTEGFGLPALEALSAGRPVCAANAGALPEVVGDLGCLCDPLSPSSIAAALERAVHDPAVQARAGSEGPRWAAQRDWDRTADGLVAACRQAAVARS